MGVHESSNNQRGLVSHIDNEPMEVDSRERESDVPARQDRTNGANRFDV